MNNTSSGGGGSGAQRLALEVGIDCRIQILKGEIQLAHAGWYNAVFLAPTKYKDFF